MSETDRLRCYRVVSIISVRLHTDVWATNEDEARRLSLDRTWQYIPGNADAQWAFACSPDQSPADIVEVNPVEGKHAL